jgi:hypothetical protein
MAVELRPLKPKTNSPEMESMPWSDATDFKGGPDEAFGATGGAADGAFDAANEASSVVTVDADGPCGANGTSVVDGQAPQDGDVVKANAAPDGVPLTGGVNATDAVVGVTVVTSPRPAVDGVDDGWKMVVAVVLANGEFRRVVVVVVVDGALDGTATALDGAGNEARGDDTGDEA